MRNFITLLAEFKKVQIPIAFITIYKCLGLRLALLVLL